MKNLLTAFSLSFLWMAGIATASPANAGLDHISTPNVTCMTEDADGYIWMGTARGLNRYNGSTYRVWYQGEGSLTDDAVTSVCADGQGRIWVGTSSGVNLVRDGRADPACDIRCGRVGNVYSIDDKRLLYSSRDGLHLLDKDTYSSSPVYQDPKLLYNTFTVLSDGKIWIRNTASGIITILSPDWHVIREFPAPENLLSKVTEAPDGSIYTCTGAGLLRFTSDGAPLPVPETLRNATQGKPVLFMAVKDSDMFIGIRNEGIFYIGNDGPRREWIQESLTGVGSCRALLTRENLWLSKDNAEPVNLYRHPLQHTLSLPDRYRPDALNMFYPTGNGQILVITNRGVFRQQLSNGDWTELPGDGIGNGNKLGITLLDRNNNLWILYNYTYLREYAVGADRLNLLAEWPVETTASIWDDAQGNVFLLQSNHLLRFSPDGRRERLPAEEHPEFWFCGQFGPGRPYFLAQDAIWLLDEGRNFRRMDLAVQSPSCVWEDAKGNWWIGSRNNGLFHYDPREGTLTPVSMAGEAADKTIRSVAGDREGNIWVASRFDYTRISEDGTVLVLNGDHAINNTNSLAITDNGSPVFGSTSKLTWFPARIQAGQRQIPLSLDGIAINGETLFTDVTSQLTLDHQMRQLTFSFSGKNFDPGLQPIYQYKLEGLDREWIYADQNQRASYTSLHPGRYTFRVRVQQPDGTWSPDELRIPIHIKPSPWLSWPAVLAYLALLLALMIFSIRQFIHFQVNREKLEISEQEKLLVEQISQERTTFFTNVSHEFRTPLSLIYGPVRELDRSETLSEKDRNLVHLIERNSKRMLRLTDQLLHFNQSRANRDNLTIIRTDLTVLLRQMLKNFEYMFTQKNLRAAMDMPSELVVYCDREKVERIIFNLLSNAVKYTPEHGEIIVSANTDGDSAWISVSDTGIGISPDKQERIFERYERLGEQVGDSLPSGFGIGLNYARHLAQLHKGDLSVRPNDPIGSVFTFTFPFRREAYVTETVWQEEDGAAPEENTAAPAEPATGASILVVEDNPDMREYIRGFLSEECKVTLAGDGEEAWKLIRISAPDLVISDVMMPYKDGYTLCKELKNDPEYCHIPVILLTAKADMENQIHGLELGADGYVGKPFDPAYLTALVRNLLATRRRLQGMLADRTSTSTDENPAPEEGLSPQDKAFLEKCYKIIDKHLAEEDFGVTFLSMEMGMSRTSIFSKLKALVGQSPQTFLTNYRLNRGMELLQSHEYNISEVAYKVGCGTLTGFSRAFKNKFGVPPSQI